MKTPLFIILNRKNFPFYTLNREKSYSYVGVLKRVNSSQLKCENSSFYELKCENLSFDTRSS